jgi:hypothetical protein
VEEIIKTMIIPVYRGVRNLKAFFGLECNRSLFNVNIFQKQGDSEILFC